MATVVKLGKHEKVLAAAPEFCSGPGWSNMIVNVHIYDYQANAYRVVYLQPDAITNDMHLIFGIGAKMQKMLIDAVPTKESK